MRKVYANALLSDGEILFWYTGDECKSPEDFYKDFYYSKINMTEYLKTHKCELDKIGFVIKPGSWDYNNFIFEVLAKEFYRQYPISEDSKGQKPY